MASEITLPTVSLAAVKGTTNVSFSVTGITPTMSSSAAKHVRNVQNIGTSEEALQLGDVGTCGYILLVNRDATNFVKVRMGAGAADVIKLKAGEFALFRLAGNTPYMIADTGACNVEYLLLED